MRIGAVSYLNTKPLIYGLSQRLPEAEIVLDFPSHLADRLAAGDLDVALIPSLEYFRGNDWQIVSDACIACRGAVRSVRLLFRTPPPQVASLALDEGSRTSAALAQILLHERFGVRPQLQPLPIDAPVDSVDADAVLIIGDRAMELPCRDWVETWDLGTEWMALTEMPFVFAMWVAGPVPLPNAIAAAFEASRNAGLAAARRIAEAEAPAYGLTADDCWRYFTEQLHFRLGPRERAGLDLFHRLALSLELIPHPPTTIEQT
ncbi:MAG: hypothetical protein D6753_07695 [Planctomycetota bacterium]|nr:MAG: hypothetical protein D6753_07695 [Planctomycetota bacterium]